MDTPIINRLTSVDRSLFKALDKVLTEISKSNPEYTDSEINALLSDDQNILLTISLSGMVVGGLTAYVLPMFTRKEYEIFIYEIEVLEPYRRKGFASLLLEELFRITSESRISSCFLLTESDNQIAQRLYEKCGGKTEDAIIYAFDRRVNKLKF